MGILDGLISQLKNPTNFNDPYIQGLQSQGLMDANGNYTTGNGLQYMAGGDGQGPQAQSGLQPTTPQYVNPQNGGGLKWSGDTSSWASDPTGDPYADITATYAAPGHLRSFDPTTGQKLSEWDTYAGKGYVKIDPTAYPWASSQTIQLPDGSYAAPYNTVMNGQVNVANQSRGGNPTAMLAAMGLLATGFGTGAIPGLFGAGAAATPSAGTGLAGGIGGLSTTAGEGTLATDAAAMQAGQAAAASGIGGDFGASVAPYSARTAGSVGAGAGAAGAGSGAAGGGGTIPPGAGAVASALPAAMNNGGGEIIPSETGNVTPTGAPAIDPSTGQPYPQMDTSGGSGTGYGSGGIENIINSADPQVLQWLKNNAQVLGLGATAVGLIGAKLNAPSQPTGAGSTPQDFTNAAIAQAKASTPNIVGPYGSRKTTWAQDAQGNWVPTVTSTDNGQIPKAPVNPGTTGLQAMMARLQPIQQHETDALNTQLRNQGLAPGGEAYNYAADTLNRSHNDAQQQAVLNSIGLDTAANQNAFTQFNSAVGPSSGTAPAPLFNATQAGSNYNLGLFGLNQANNNSYLQGLGSLGAGIAMAPKGSIFNP